MNQEALYRELINAPVLTEHDEAHIQPVLLETGPHDEAVRYFAVARSVSYSGEYLVYVAECSLLLDLVRFKRSLDVVVSFSSELRYEGTLSLANIRAPMANQSALALSITGPAQSAGCVSERYCPIT